MQYCVHAVAELQERSRRVEKLLTEINEEISTLQNEKQDLEFDIDDLHTQLNAAKISQEYKDKVGRYICCLFLMQLYRGHNTSYHYKEKDMPS